eukprot:Trichotokara_eunicae@DN6375_c0_g1_i1.p1
MDTVVALAGDDFVAMGCDTYASSSLFRIKHDEDKIDEIDGNKLFSSGGPPGDRRQFSDFIKANAHLRALWNGRPMTTHALANYTRTQMAKLIRQNPHNVNCLIGGTDMGQAKLFWMDYLGSLAEVQKGATGYAGYLTTGILDRWYKPHLTEDEAVVILKKCFFEMKERFAMSQSSFLIKIVKADGTINTQKVDM